MGVSNVWLGDFIRKYPGHAVLLIAVLVVLCGCEPIPSELPKMSGYTPDWKLYSGPPLYPDYVVVE